VALHRFDVATPVPARAPPRAAVAPRASAPTRDPPAGASLRVRVAPCIRDNGASCSTAICCHV